MGKNKVLIIRFSSFGDIVQCSSVVELISQRFSSVSDERSDEVEIHWATRTDFDFLVQLNHRVDKVWALDKKLGLIGLIKFSLFLRTLNFTHVYDAHNNLRSFVLNYFLMAKWFNRPFLIRRSKDRWKRFLLFYLKINKFPQPFKGIQSFIGPLLKWDISLSWANPSFAPMVKWVFPKNTIEKMSWCVPHHPIIAIVPSAAWEMKRWPLDHWKELIKILPHFHFYVLGGKEDLFCEELVEVDSKRVINLSGKLSLVESCYFISNAKLVISADTGLLHVADVLGVKALSLIGPTAFGFTTSSKIKSLETNLVCRPCTKDGSGKCTQKIWQKCMVEITPKQVANEVINVFGD